MEPDIVESSGVSLVAHTDLNGRPPFKMGLQMAEGRMYMYLAHFWFSGWTVLDVTDPHRPDVVTFVEGPSDTSTKNIQISDGLMIASLERPSEGYGPIDDPMDPGKNEEGAYVFDVGTDPTDPDHLGHYETGGQGTHRNFYNGGEYAYMMAWPEDFEGGMLTVVDVSDPSDPVEAARWWWDGQHPDDDADPDQFFYGHGPAYVQGDRAFVSYGRVGPVVLDVSDPTEPELVTHLAMGDGFGSFLGVHSFVPLPDSDLAVASTEALNERSPLDGGEALNYTALVDVSDERPFDYPAGTEAAGPKYVSTVPRPTPENHLPYDNYYEKDGRFGPHNLHHHRNDPLRYRSNDLLIMTWFNAGLRIFDISDPLAPTEVGYCVPADPKTRIGPRPETGLVTHFEDVVVDHRGYIYCSDTNNGLFVFESALL